MCVCVVGCDGGERLVPCVNCYKDLIQLNKTDLGVFSRSHMDRWHP